MEILAGHGLRIEPQTWYNFTHREKTRSTPRIIKLHEIRDWAMSHMAHNPMHEDEPYAWPYA